MIRAFTPEVEQLQLGCGLKQVDVPVVSTYKKASGSKNNLNGELISLEFVPKNFELDSQ